MKAVVILLAFLITASAYSQGSLIDKKPGQWYEGGTLHKSKISEWKRGTEANKLATCADFIAKIYPNVSLSVIKIRATDLRACINESTEGLSTTNTMLVTEVASLCLTLLGYDK